MKCPTELKIRSITKHWPLILKSYRQKRGSISPRYDFDESFSGKKVMF